MTQPEFHSEWITIGDHRIFLECRLGFPNEYLRFIAELSAVTCDHNSKKARVVKVYNDDKNSVFTIHVASTESEDAQLEETLRTVLHGAFNNGNCQPEISIVERGNEDSDSYDHMRHLHTQTEGRV